MTCRILLTAFEPFGEHRVNASALAARTVAAHPPPGVVVETLLLPVVFGDAFAALARRLATSSAWDAVVLTGMAARTRKLRVERVALNLQDTEVLGPARSRRPPRPDNAGRSPVDEVIVAGAPLALAPQVDVKRLVRTVAGAGYPVELSLSAGSFVCNDLYFRTLHHLSTLPAPPACLFVHIPALPRRRPQRLFGISLPFFTTRTRGLAPAPAARALGALLERLAGQFPGSV